MILGDWIFLGIGLVSGGIVGGCIVGKVCAKEYQGRLEELQKERDQLIEEKARDDSRGLLERQKGIVEAEKRLDKNLSSLKTKKDNKKPVRSFEELSKSYRSDMEGEDPDDVIAEHDGSLDDEDDLDLSDYDISDDDIEESDGESDPQIRVIDKESFNNELAERDAETMTFYQEDQILTDAAQEVVHDKEELLGEEGLRLCEDTRDDTIYIDNEIDDILYEVIVEHNASYYRDILGAG